MERRRALKPYKWKLPRGRDRPFDPHLPIEYGDGDIVSVGKTVYYRDVHLFVSRVRP